MTTQAVTDIKELVGEMPARGCECRIHGCNGTTHEHGCDRQAAWIVRIHGADMFEHGNFVMDLCDECLGVMKNIKASLGPTCRFCGESWSMLVMPL
ncbi:hypothetical protein BST32_01820 [Mycobacteroides abscessus subsp. massiliense]|nr:hypothetical protein BST32_01820 [Mycobacteroides abscessus subsp. massiliense]WJJ56374.1 hypothetical protein PROPHICCUG48898T2_34 [Mycobacterium phage CCUG48898T-2]